MEGTGGLCIGDQVCLYCVNSAGYVFSDQTSSARNRLHIHHEQDRQNPDNIPNPEVVTFEVCIQMRYKLKRKLHRLHKTPATGVSKEEFRYIKEAAAAESKDNQLEASRLRGKQVKYGHIIQLRHVFSGKSIHVDTTRTSSRNKNKLVVHLKSHDAKTAQFRVLPMYRINSIGEPVSPGDQVCLESVKTPGHYLHASKPYDFQGLDKSCELNVGVEAAAFTLYCRLHPASTAPNHLRGGSIIQLQHRHMEAYLVAEGSFGSDKIVTESAHLWVRESDFRVPSTLYPPTSSATYWQVEAAHSTIDGSPLYWGQYFRLRHYNTRLYLGIDRDQAVTLFSQPRSPRTVFQLHPMAIQKANSVIDSGTCGRIQNVVTGTWLCAMKDKTYTRKTLKWRDHDLKKLGSSKEMRHQDAFCLQLVERHLVEDCNIIAGMAGLIHSISTELAVRKDLDSSRIEALVTVITELQNFISKAPVGHACKFGDRREVLREMKILDLLGGFLQDSSSLVDSSTLKPIHLADYELLHQFIIGGSGEDCLYLSQFLDNFLAHLSVEDDVTLQVTGILVELIRDRRNVLERLTRRQRDSFTKLIKKAQHPRYLQLLGTLCTCAGVAIPDNQTRICDKLFNRKKIGLYKLALVESAVHVTKDPKEGTQELGIFLKRATLDERQFLVEQLHLFKKLVHGRNQYCIDVITSQTQAFTFDIAMAVLLSHNISDNIKAIFCDLVIVFFIDVGKNTSILDLQSDTFIYNKVECNSQATREWITQQQCLVDKSLELMLQPLKQWIEGFLKANPYMVADQMQRNCLAKSVFEVMRALIMFGYCNPEDLVTWISYLLNLIKGTHDLPFQTEKKSGFFHGIIESTHYERIFEGLRRQNTQVRRVNVYRNKARFEKSSDTDAIVDAKYQAMRVLEVLFELIAHLQVEKLVAIFKDIDSQPHQGKGQHNPLLHFLREHFTQIHIGRFQRDPVKLLHQEIEGILEETSLMEDKAIVDAMLDMASYNYEHMTTKSLELLIKHCFARETLQTNAKQTQLLMTKASLAIQRDVLAFMPLLRRLVAVNFHQDQLDIVVTILDKFNEICTSGEDHSSNMLSQNILVNHGLLSLLVILLDHKSDTNNMKEYKIKLESSVLGLMASVSRDNPRVQQLLFHKLDIILRAQSSLRQLAAALIEIFRGNRELCWQVDHQQVAVVVGLLARSQERAPELVDVLGAWVQGAGRAIHRNQLLIMKRLLHTYPSCAYVFEVPFSERRSVLQLQQGRDVLCYYIKLVRLLALCGKGASGSILSFCQNVITMSEVLQILNTAAIASSLKRHFVKYLHWVFFMQATPEKRDKMTHHSKIWEFLKHVSEDLDKCSQYLSECKDTLSPLKGMDECDTPNADDAANFVYYTMDYILDSVLNFFCDFVQCLGISTDLAPEKLVIIKNISNTLIELLPGLNDLVTNPRHFHALKTAVNILTTYLGLQPQEIDAAVTTIERTRPARARHGLGDTARCLEQAQEVGTNLKFRWFTANIEHALQPANTLRVQLGITHDMANKEYVNIHSVHALPLCPGFRKLVKTFTDTSSKVPSGRFQKATALIRQLGFSAEKAKDGLETGTDDIDVTCLQVLRALLYNQIVLLPATNEPKTTRGNRYMRRLRATQEWMVEQGLVPICFKILNRPNRQLIKAVLALLSCLLHDALPCVQDACLKFFQSTREEVFFLVVQDQFQRSALWFRERKIYHARTSRAAPDMQRRCSPKLNAFLFNGSLETRPSISDDVTSMDTTSFSDGVGRGDLLEYQGQGAMLDSDDGDMVELLLSTLASLCDGQQTQLQNYMRDQSDNLKSYDLVAEVTRFLAHTVGSRDFLKITKEVFNTLAEFCQGNQENRMVVLNNKVVDHVNLVLRSDLFETTDLQQALGTYGVIADFLISMLEERSPQALQVAKEVAVTIDHDAILRVLTTCHRIYNVSWWRTLRKNKINPIEPLNQNELQDAWNVGYKNFIIHSRLEDVHLDLTWSGKSRVISWKDKHKKALSFYQNSVHSIEILKDNDIQKVYFPLTERNMIATDMKQRIKWNIDRSSTTSKVRELLQWSQVIMADTNFHRNDLWRPLRVLVMERQVMWSYLCILLSLVINIIMLVTWKAKASMTTANSTSSLPADIYNPTPDVVFLDGGVASRVRLGLGVIHNFSSVLVVMGYFLSTRPSLPSIKTVSLWARNVCRKAVGKQKIQEDRSELSYRHSVLSFTTLYYLVFLALSVAGTAGNSYTFAFHLLHIVSTNQLLKGIIQAVSLNLKSLLWVAVLGLVVLYLYALIAFVFLRPSFTPSDQMYCNRLYECAVSIVRYGMLGDIGEKLVLHELEAKQFSRFGWLVLYQVSFFILFTTIGLNIIFGIIVDTFSELRNRKWEAERDMRELCFICGQPSYKFEQQGKGFNHHVRNEHNMWDYLHYLNHLSNIQPTDYTTLDIYVSTLVKQNRHDFFPLNRAMCLDGSRKDPEESMMASISTNIHHLLQKHTREETRVISERDQQLRDTLKEAEVVIGNIEGSTSVRLQTDGRSSFPLPQDSTTGIEPPDGSSLQLQPLDGSTSMQQSPEDSGALAMQTGSVEVDSQQHESNV